MALPLKVILLLLVALAMVAEASAGITTAVEPQWALARLSGEDVRLEKSTGTCDGLVGECIDGEVEETEVESDISRRGLYGVPGHVRFISYGALTKNRVPCNRRGQSYYNCQRRGRANPYRRGCSVITRCARFLH